MSQILVRYFVNSVLLDGSAIHGVQTATLNRSSDVTAIIPKGAPNSVKNFYKKPAVSVSFTKFLSPSISSIVSGFNLRNTITASPIGYTLAVGVLGGGGFTLTDAILSSVVFNYTSQGFFTEEVTYTGHLISGNAGGGSEFAGEEDIVYRRQHFTKSIPSGIPETVLLSVTASLNINYGQIPTYGGLLSIEGKYISFPVDVSCTYEMLDTGVSTIASNETTASTFGAIKDAVTDVAISISGPPTINLGSKNFLSSIDRSGGDAGQSNYSTVKYTFKNNDNSFTVS
jgi:hypothetical protein